MDQFTRRIIGFGVQRGDPDGTAVCRMFNQAIAGMDLPKYLSTDNDPLYRFHRWQANLRILEVTEIKTACCANIQPSKTSQRISALDDSGKHKS